MSDKTIAAIQDALQAHINSFPGPDEQVTDFVVMYSALDDKGDWKYSYVRGPLTNPHSSLGVASIVGAMLSDDMIPVAPE